MYRPSSEDECYDLGEREAEDVARWRLSRLLELGLTLEQAQQLEHLSWHEVERLIRLGCPLDQVALILT